jgi:hypothetical protein
MRRLPIAAILVVLTAVALVAAPLEGREPRRTLHVDLEDELDGGLSLTLEGAWLEGLVAALAVVDVGCERTTDPELGALLRHLEREGEGSRAEMREDGDRVIARRRRGHLEIRVIDAGGERAEVVVPWPLARCFLGRAANLGDALDAVRGAGLHLRVRGEDGSLRIRLD